ncbi:DNA polymerase subunit gamma-1, mitochondrial [Chionoecetes opilio]|uniref:DNA-directed DNA polymerase n=1 Tax=Chionoecetes opilio TaxID=41210 RepID=A0A8J4Y266_CHIOP|nr:DNA polymerase subunit gamma-1, mitochondrial [Chionoecetes opilio]
MLKTLRVPWLCGLEPHAWVSPQARLTLSYCKINYFMKRYKSSKLVKKVRYTKKDAQVGNAQKHASKILLRVLKKNQDKLNSCIIVRKGAPVLQKENLIESHVETKMQNDLEQESDHVPKIEITSVNEVLEKVVGKFSHKDYGSLNSHFTENSCKDTEKGNTGISKDYRTKIVPIKKDDYIKVNSKKRIFLDKGKRMESSGMPCDNHPTENSCRSQPYEKGDASEGKTDINDPAVNIMDMNTKYDKAAQASQDIRRNSLGIQMISQGIYDQLFKEFSEEGSQNAEDLEKAKEHLQAHGLWGKTSSVMPSVEIKLPKLESNDLDQHFRVIAEDQCFHYKELLNTLIGDDLPSYPSQWEFTPGWTRYNIDGSSSPVDYPECCAVVFDVEVCVKEGNQPTLATAVSNKYWYSWCSEALIHPNSHPERNEVAMRELIPLETPSGSDSPRVVVGHNVSYDRLRVCEQYLLEETPLRFVDTMSLHIAASGLVSEQRALLMKNNKSEQKVRLPWMSVGCQNSLDEVYKFYCRNEKGLEKSIRNIFVNGSLSNIREDFQNLMSYCASDVRATHKVLVKLLPLFFERFPHPVTFSGMLEMGSTFLPVTRNWEKYIEAAEFQYHQIESLLNEELVKQVQASLNYTKDKEYENDPWLWSLDWSQPKGKVRKLPGYPNWYRKLCARTGEKEGTPEPENMSTSLQIVPKILRLTWSGFPLYYERKFGWGYLKPNYHSFEDIPNTEWEHYSLDADNVPIFPVKVFYDTFGDESESKKSSTLKEVKVSDESTEDWEAYAKEFYGKIQGSRKRKGGKSNKDGNVKNIGIPGVGFIPLPHKDGAGCRVGNPLAKDFLNKIEDGTLTSHLGDVAKLVLKTSKSLSYWKNNRDRIRSQMVVWSDHSSLPDALTSSADYTRDNQYGVILPLVVTAGTITRRAVERTWMTASNAYTDRIGSELKAMVEAPPGKTLKNFGLRLCLEMHISRGEHGCHCLGWMTLQGKKSDGTDMHSHTARSAGISRDHAKVINYGRIYGAGLRFIQRLLQQYNPKLTDSESRKQAEHLYAVTKGEKGWYLNEAGEKLSSELGHQVTEEAFPRKKVDGARRARRRLSLWRFLDLFFPLIVPPGPFFSGVWQAVVKRARDQWLVGPEGREKVSSRTPCRLRSWKSRRSVAVSIIRRREGGHGRLEPAGQRPQDEEGEPGGGGQPAGAGAPQFGAKRSRSGTRPPVARIHLRDRLPKPGGQGPTSLCARGGPGGFAGPLCRRAPVRRGGAPSGRGGPWFGVKAPPRLKRPFGPQARALAPGRGGPKPPSFCSSRGQGPAGLQCLGAVYRTT